MTFGQVKSIIETNLLDSYKNEKEFKKTLREFKENVLKNKEISKLFSVYEQLSTPQNLNEKDAEHYLNEGLNLISKILPTVKLPYSNGSTNNLYSDIDNLVYTNKLDLKERVQSKKNILNTLMSESKKINEGVKIPISSMVKIANQTLENYVQNMDDDSRKLFIEIVKGDKKKMESEYNDLKENTITKLNQILSEQEEMDLKSKISETIEKLQKEEFTQLNFVKLVSLENSL